MPPPRTMPDEMLSLYTMGGKVPVYELYFDDSVMPSAAALYKKEAVDDYLASILRKETFQYEQTDLWLYAALEKHGIQGKNVGIIGSVKPVYESICLAYGGKPFTIEYNPIISEDPRIVVFTPDQYKKNPMQFDAAFSISSLEHDGLGRYGDPLNPNADIEMMRTMRSMVNDNGILYLAIPVGKDAVVWNAHRIYGMLRLPKLLQGWRILDIIGAEHLMLQKKYTGLHGLQPVIVLQNKNTELLFTHMTLLYYFLKGCLMKLFYRLVSGPFHDKH